MHSHDYVVPFIEGNNAHEHTEPFYVTGHFDWPAPVLPELSFLTAIDVHVDGGAIDAFALVEPGGAPIIWLSGEMLAIIGNTVPIVLDESGRGALANMSAHDAYRIRMISKNNEPVQGRITYHGRNLAAPVDHRGRPVQTVPPQAGITQYWSNILHVIVQPSDTFTEVSRVGNYIRELIFTFQDRQRFCIERPSLQWDHQDITRFVNIQHDDIGVYRVTFPKGGVFPYGMLETYVRTRLRFYYLSPHRGTVHIGINDVSQYIESDARSDAAR